MARKVEVGKLTLEELKKLRKEIDSTIAGYAERRRADAMKAIEAVAKEHGMSIDEIVGSKGRKRKMKTAAKYANPENPSQTWSGRGRQPAWFKTAIESGISPESMAI